ncbi:MAG: RNA polymerase sigma factor [Saprospiraceae bacterium]|nr:RNA polymerase sigma factor [Saprospiraceae bacterium]MDW8230759.1 RNA polymerase sigma factor [Saprospiraceae bacterium]
MADKHNAEESRVSELLRQCRQQKRSAQHQLFQIFYNYAMSIARRYVGSIETAEEVVSDAFFKAFTKINLYEESLSFRFWLRRIVINTAIDRLRSALQTRESEPWNGQYDAPVESSVVEDLTREQILATLDRLPPAYRTVFNLFVVDGYTHEEIAQLLGISTGTSKSNLSRARQHLRALFSDDFEFKK